RATLESGAELVVRYSSDTQVFETPSMGASLAEERVMGDDSRRYNLAPSSDPLYLRIGTKDRYVLYGDFRIPGDRNRFTRDFGRLTGALLSLGSEKNGASLSLYASALKWAEHTETL